MTLKMICNHFSMYSCMFRDSSGNLFYTDNENPYVDIKLYPQDNWNDIIAAYVRKNAVPGPMEAQRVARDQI